MLRTVSRAGAATALSLAFVVGALSISSVLAITSVGRGSEPALNRRLAELATTVAADTFVTNRYRWRSLGPDIGGRSIAVSGVRGRPNEAYFGAVGGGLWKTTDAGQTWAPITDGQIRSASVGAVAVSETSPDVVWIGMGETCIRGNIMPGDGVYKSTDAGKTWTHMGFQSSDAISKIRIHPRNPDIVFVASFGKYGTDSEDRGVFKTTNGGRTWRRVLFKDEKSGAIDISIDQTNPNVMYAALWEAYRKEYQMSSGGPGSGLYKSTDGGENWTEITRNPGLPEGMVGRIGVSVSPANPRRVYALIENENGGLFLSDDAGATWRMSTQTRNIRQRAFYFTHVAADPRNAETIYLGNVSLYRSTDGGRTMSGLGGSHSDHHDIWIDPDNPQHLVLANDGGGAVSMNGGTAWSGQAFPTPQIYHIAATHHNPYHICGAQQDGGSFCMPLTPAGRGAAAGGRGAAPTPAPAPGRGGAPAAATRYNVGGSENGYMAADPLDTDVYYVGTNANGGGFLDKVNRRTGENREVNPYPRMFSGEESALIKERWQWTYPIIFSQADPKALYVSSQHLWKTTDGGTTWARISPDLTRHDPSTMGPSGGPITRDMNGPEVYAVIFSVGPSKRDPNVIWTGSDDGLVHVTRTGGGVAPTSWVNVTPKEMPEFGRVSQIDASAFNTGTAYVSVRRPLLSDRAPYIFRTHDFGRTWTKIVNGIGEEDYVHAVREDPYRRGLLYAATQHGVYISYNDGDLWQSLSLNLPDVPVSDLIVQPRELAISTHGRGFYVLDDINLLRYADRVVGASGPLLLTSVPAVRTQGSATIQYWLKTPTQGIKIEVLDSAGKAIRTFAGGTAVVADTSAAAAAAGGRGGRGGGGAAGAAPPMAAGLNSVTWDLRHPNATTFPGMILWGAGGTTGPLAAPGTYRVRMTIDGNIQTQNLVVKRNPLFTATDADLRAQTALALQIRDKFSEANQAVIDIRRMKTQVADRLTQSSDSTLKARGDTLTKRLSAVEEEIYQVRNQSGQDPLNFPIKINNRLGSLLTGVVNAGEGRPTIYVQQIFRDVSAELLVQTNRLRRVIATDLATFNTEAKRLGLEEVTAK
jgi:photosystem II stability/assembly factor-like uncharacterized protein